MPDPLLSLPLDAIDAIDAEALPRDRTSLCPEALAELRASILASGLRQPVEVFALAEPEGSLRYGLISGYRRLLAFRALVADGLPFAEIPAFLRAPGTLEAALAAMVEENEVRAETSPWEKGMIAVTATRANLFPTLDAAIDALFSSADRMKRSRLRALAMVAEALDDLLVAPETLSQRQLLRLAAALRAGFSELLRTALEESRAADTAAQWTLLQPVLHEAEQSLKDDTPYTPGRPRRVLRPRANLTIRRELAPEDWVLRFTGRDATGPLMESVLDEIERLFGP
jgi:ParB family chromosome partitioning protein